MSIQGSQHIDIIRFYWVAPVNNPILINGMRPVLTGPSRRKWSALGRNLQHIGLSVENAGLQEYTPGAVWLGGESAKLGRLKHEADVSENF